MCEDFIEELCDKWSIDIKSIPSFSDENETISHILEQVKNIITRKVIKDIPNYDPPIIVHFCQSRVEDELYYNNVELTDELIQKLNEKYI